MTAPIAPDEFADALAAAWLDINPRQERPIALGARFRHSNAGKCARYLQYEELGIEKSEPLTYTARMVFKMGDHVHDEIQSALAAQWGDDCTLEWEGLSFWMDGSLHSDATIDLGDGRVVVVEIKSINGFGYKLAIGAGRGDAEGPRSSAKLQAAMNACSTPNCVGAYIVYASHEALSVNVAKQNNISERGRILHVWWMDIDECVALATPEFERLNAIGAWIDAHPPEEAPAMEGGQTVEPTIEWIPRKIPTLPKGARITDPMTGTWQIEREGNVVDIGTTWECSYCAYQTRCNNDGP